jgi:LmbE family N-acetylglucosaminyl deacetylase
MTVTPKIRRLLNKRFLLIALAAIAISLVIYSWLVSSLAWKRTLRAAGFVDELPEPGRGDRLLIVAPHPDDETLGCGGLIRQAMANGAAVDVVIMTNGDASEWSVLLGEREIPWNPANLIELGRKRQRESLRALSEAGVSAHHVHFLGFPNNGLVALWRPEHWRHSDLYQSPYTRVAFSPYEQSLTPDAPYCGQQVLSDLMAVMHVVRPTQIYVTHPRDIHPDHWATSCFVSYALATAEVKGAEWAKSAQLWGYLVHWPRYPAPMRSGLGLELLPPPELSGAEAQWYRLPLTRDEARRKLAAIRTYRSQGPRFDRLLQSFARQDEIFEALSGKELKPGAAAQWRTRNAHRRGLGGAEVRGLSLRVGDDLVAEAKVTTAPRKIPESGYVCLDLRTWDEHLAPAIATVYLRALGQAAAVRLEAPSGPRPLAAEVDADTPGKIGITHLSLPTKSQAGQDLFVTCYGSVKDRLTDPAVASWVRFRRDAAAAR